MSSPFPGMDPYLEGHLWPDVHHRLATEISRRLTPRLKPRYVARLEIYVVEDTEPEAEIGIMYPDVEVLTADRRRPLSSQGGAPSGEAIAEAPMTVSLAPPEVRVANVEVRDATSNKLVTGIEILSPVNKRGKGLEAYRKKRERLRKASVHVLEIDLLRRGERSLASTLPRVPDTPYRITLIRARFLFLPQWYNPRRGVSAMPTTPNLVEVAEILKRHLPEGYQAVVFGSRATGKARKGSDWDIGILGPKPLRNIILGDIREELEEMRTLHTFDVVDLTTVPDYFRRVALRKTIKLVWPQTN